MKELSCTQKFLIGCGVVAVAAVAAVGAVVAVKEVQKRLNQTVATLEFDDDSEEATEQEES